MTTSNRNAARDVPITRAGIHRRDLLRNATATLGVGVLSWWSAACGSTRPGSAPSGSGPRNTSASQLNPAAEQGEDMYGIIGQMLATEGDRDRLIEILLEGTRDMPGCRLYAISKDVEDATAIWITEIWDSEEAHRASLELPAVQAAIAEGRPLITGFGARHTVQPVGGIGV